INRTEPTAEQINTRRQSAALVETAQLERGTYSPQLVVLGTVEPAQEIVLSPRIRGQITELSEKFVPGGMAQKGDLLLQIDPADFENAISIRESELEQAEASLAIEEGRQSVAKQELALLGDTIDELNRALVLREPQYASIKSQVSAAEAAVQRAQLDLERTRVVAPFDAQILRRSANIGSQVGPGDDIGRLVGVDEYWIMTAVPVRSLRWIQFPDSDTPGSKVTLHYPDAWGHGVKREAQVARMIGALDEQSRLARVLVTVPDPLGQSSDDPPLILDTLIEVRIEGKQIDDVVRVRREHLHAGDTVWVMKNEKLEIREPVIEFNDAEYAYVSEGLESGEEIVTTTLATVAEGIGLRKIGESTPAADYEESTQ
ncbi:MAG: efflux RND transporter periplasmic adaptor subunit, partial [Planctomycetales bacterium]|nr:efflux RND transporter periplasmic adaptor subunit [Planctomycetales bacterium]